MRVLIAAAVGVLCGIGIAVAAIATGFIGPFKPQVSKEEWGSFPVAPKLELLDDGRRARLLEDFVYISPGQRVWTASKDTIVDGASIPRIFWTISEGPWEGQFRNASIVHDEACDRMTDEWQDVHMMFYEGCRCGGVSEYKAKVLYAAVYHFGPRWKLRQVMEQRMTTNADGSEEAYTVTRTVAEIERGIEEPSTEVQNKLEAFIQNKNPSLEDIAALDPASL